MSRPVDDVQAFRAQELLLQRATSGLSDAELAELAALGGDHDDSYDLAAAAIDLATSQPQPLPAEIAARILATAGEPAANTAMPSTLAGVVPPRVASAIPPAMLIEQPPVRRRGRGAVVIAWTAAAIGLAAAVVMLLWNPVRETERVVEFRDRVVAPVTPSLAQARASLLTASDARTLQWTATADPAARGAGGDVVWSAARQEGYMRFVGLAANDPKVNQYQLWIFDKQRDERYPVDGGVFDVGVDGEVIVKISPKLMVADPTLFAVTIEAPGGVVVSKRERIVVTAAPKTG